MRTRKYKSLRLVLLLHLCWLTPVGFLMKYYSGPYRHWFNDYGAGLLYELFWIVIFFILFPSRGNVRLIPVYVLISTSVLEILQLWHPYFLERIRETFIGAAIIGTTFVWWDFPHYIIGCFLGWLLLRISLSGCYSVRK